MSAGNSREISNVVAPAFTVDKIRDLLQFDI